MGTEPHAVTPPNLRECKVRASLLLKDLESSEPSRATRAAERLRALPAFARLSPAELLARRDSVRRKHALAVIAHEHGHASWAELKQALGEDEASQPRLDTEAFFAKNRGAFLNRWFASYEEALASLRERGATCSPSASSSSSPMPASSPRSGWSPPMPTGRGWASTFTTRRRHTCPRAARS